MYNITVVPMKLPVKQIQNAILTVREAHDKLIALPSGCTALRR